MSRLTNESAVLVSRDEVSTNQKPALAHVIGGCCWKVEGMGTKTPVGCCYIHGVPTCVVHVPTRVSQGTMPSNCLCLHQTALGFTNVCQLELVLESSDLGPYMRMVSTMMLAPMTMVPGVTIRALWSGACNTILSYHQNISIIHLCLPSVQSIV